MTIAAEVRVARRRRRWRRIGIGALVLGVLVGGVPYAISYSAAAARVSDRVIASRDLDAIARAMRSPRPELLDSAVAAGRRIADVPLAPDALRNAARIWVDTLNAWNPYAILYAKPDARGNLYLTLGAWFYTLTEDDQMLALDRLGTVWRQYIKDTFGAWDDERSGRVCFAPGIVVVDDQGLVGRNLNCRVELARRRPT